MSDASLPLDDAKHERFARLCAEGAGTVEEIYQRTISARRGVKTLTEAALKLQAVPEVAGRIAFLQASAVAAAGTMKAESAMTTVTATTTSGMPAGLPAGVGAGAGAGARGGGGGSGLMSAGLRRTLDGEVLSLLEKRQICAEIARSAEKESDRLSAIKVDNDLASEGAEAQKEAAVIVVKIGGTDEPEMRTADMRTLADRHAALNADAHERVASGVASGVASDTLSDRSARLMMLLGAAPDAAGSCDGPAAEMGGCTSTGSRSSASTSTDTRTCISSARTSTSSGTRKTTPRDAAAVTRTV